MNINVPEYNNSFLFVWEEGFSIRCSIHEGSVWLEANKPGLISLARHLLELAQDNVPEFCHFHLDDYADLEENSSELIIIKRNLT